MINLPDFQTLLDYYTSLLIMQYRELTKAKSHIELYANVALGNLLIWQLERAFDVDTAVGAQLDILAKYVGCQRSVSNYIIGRKYFELNNCNNLSFESINGFSEAGNTTLNWGLIFYGLNGAANRYTMNDSELRTMIKFLIIKNNTRGTFSNVLSTVYNTFGSDILLTDNLNMTWTIKVPQTYSNVLSICISQNYFPRPVGIRLILNII